MNDSPLTSTRSATWCFVYTKLRHEGRELGPRPRDNFHYKIVLFRAQKFRFENVSVGLKVRIVFYMHRAKKNREKKIHVICTLNARLNRDASGVFAWANLNDMTLNTSKPKSILIATQQKFHRLNERSIDVMINGKLIEQVQHAKLLDVTLDCHLTWEKHIDNICSIVNSRLSLLRRIKPFLTRHCALRFFNFCIHNHLIYYSSARGNCSSYLLSRLIRVQKRAAILLLDADFTQSAVSLFSKLKWLPILDLIKLRKLVPLFTILNNPDAPFCLKRKFNFLSSLRSTGLRTRACAFNLQVPYPRSNSGKRTLAYSAATLFNCLDNDLKQIACVSPSSITFSSRLNNFKHKPLTLFHKFVSNVSHLEELMCYGCRFSLYCKCIRR